MIVAASSEEIVRLVDKILSGSIGDLCSCLIMDGEGCNQVVRRLIQGVPDADAKRKLDSTVFFKHLRHEPFPLKWPRVPQKLCTISGDPFFAVVGPAHTMKNAAGQIQSHIRTLFFGDHFADLAGSLQQGMPWPAFQRADPMSDRLCSLLAAPLFLLSAVASWVLMLGSVSFKRAGMKWAK